MKKRASDNNISGDDSNVVGTKRYNLRIQQDNKVEKLDTSTECKDDDNNIKIKRKRKRKSKEPNIDMHEKLETDVALSKVDVKALDKERVPWSPTTHEEIITLLHNRMAHINLQKLVEGFKHQLFTGYTIPRSYLGKKGLKKLNRCSSCLKNKMRRRTYHRHYGEEKKFYLGEVLCLDIHVYMNIPAIDGTRYVANFTDPRSGLTLSYFLLDKTDLRDCIKLVIKDYHKRFNLKDWKYLYCDREKTIDCLKGEVILDKYNIDLITTPSDTFELNGVAEEVNKWLGQSTLTCLHFAGRSVPFWRKCYEHMTLIKSVLPCKGEGGWMSPIERLTGEIPNISHFRVWGCKAWVAEPRVEKRKDMHEPHVVGFHIGLSSSPIGWEIWIPELRCSVVSTNVEFDENIPTPKESYHRELEQALVKVSPQEMSLTEAKKLYIGQWYVDPDDGLIYQVENIRIEHGSRFIVAIVRRRGAPKSDRTPILIDHLIEMINSPRNREDSLQHFREAIEIEQARDEDATSYRSQLRDELSLVLNEVSHNSTAGEDVDRTRDSKTLTNTTGTPSRDAVHCLTTANKSTIDQIEVLGSSGSFNSIVNHRDDVSTLESLSLVQEYNEDVIMELSDLVHDEHRLLNKDVYDNDYLMLMNDGAPKHKGEFYKLSKPDQKKFKEAELKELKTIEDRGVIEAEVAIPEGINPLGCTWAYKWKDPVSLSEEGQTGPTGRTAKARLAMQDFKSTGDKLRETFAPTGRQMTFRFLLLLAMIFQLPCHHVDINAAFLYADLEKPMYMKGPPGYECAPGYCLKVVKALYGCRQAPRFWYNTLSEYIVNGLGFIKNTLDPCLFHLNVGVNMFLIYIYVDDILIFGRDETIRMQIIEKIKSKFKCKHLGVVKRFLGVWIEFSDSFDKLELSQKEYCADILDRYELAWRYKYKTPKVLPSAPDFQERLRDGKHCLSEDDKDYSWWSNFPYLEMIGAALYLAMNTRPDILFTVCMLARYSKDRPYEACVGICHLFSYLSGTVDRGIHYSVDRSPLKNTGWYGRLDLHGFSDADWASDFRTRRSTGGYVVVACGGPLAWGSKLMATVAASTMESEYMSAFYLGQELVYITNLIKSIGLSLERPIPFFMDAMAAINALKNPAYHARTKHIAVKWHWLNQFMGSLFDLHHVRSSDMAADLLTKSTVRKVWNNLVHHLMGWKQIASRNMIRAQLREKDDEFPTECIKFVKKDD